MTLPIPSSELAIPTNLILSNYQRLFNRPLLDSPNNPVAELFNAPFVMLSALGAQGTDHTFNYANQTALDAFETTWGAFIDLPSSQSAEPVHRDERRRLLDEVERHGFISDYSGIRISRKGHRFRILRATVFNLLSPDGIYIGQAATFSDWESLS